mgnify:CR=1 FL=1
MSTTRRTFIKNSALTASALAAAPMFSYGRDSILGANDRVNFAVLGVSADSARKHQNFTEKYALPFPLIPDVNKEIIQAYGVWGPKKFMGREFDGIHRETFVIDEAGKIAKVYQKVKSKEAAEQILADFN